MKKETIKFNHVVDTTKNSLQFVIAGRPITKKNRPIIVPNQTQRVLPSKQFSLYQKMAKIQLLQQMSTYSNTRFPLMEPVVVEAKYWMGDRSSWPDYTGLIQATSDILEHVGILGNDSQILTFVRSYIAGIDPENPRVDIVIIPMKNKGG